MKTLRDADGNQLTTDEEKAEGLIKDHFVWKEEARTTKEEEEQVDNNEVEEDKLEKIITKVEVALSGTQNSSAPRPDSISYRFIKRIKNTTLGEKLLEEVARNLVKGTILREWQNSKMVMIPKPRKVYEKTK